MSSASASRWAYSAHGRCGRGPSSTSGSSSSMSRSTRQSWMCIRSASCGRMRASTQAWARCVRSTVASMGRSKCFISRPRRQRSWRRSRPQRTPMAPSGRVLRRALRRLRDLLRRLEPQKKPTEEEVQREEVIVERDKTVALKARADRTNNTRVRDEDEERRINHGVPTVERLERRKRALQKVKDDIAELEELL